jgi:uncharacterized glyoxalase superfamily protein PhnB
MPGTITPYVLYEDGAAALEFLTTAFGFEEVLRHSPEGRVWHAELRLGDGNVFLGAEDPEGHSWFFAQRVRDVSPEESGATVVS